MMPWAFDLRLMYLILTETFGSQELTPVLFEKLRLNTLLGVTQLLRRFAFELVQLRILNLYALPPPWLTGRIHF